jgi:hypothetical protein
MCSHGRTPASGTWTSFRSSLSSLSSRMAYSTCLGVIRVFRLSCAMSPAISTISAHRYSSVAARYTAALALTRLTGVAFFRYRWMRPIGNCSPALVVRLTRVRRCPPVALSSGVVDMVTGVHVGGGDNLAAYACDWMLSSVYRRPNPSFFDTLYLWTVLYRALYLPAAMRYCWSGAAARVALRAVCGSLRDQSRQGGSNFPGMGRRGLDPVDFVFQLEDIVRVIAAELLPGQVVYSLLGVNTLTTRVARDVRASAGLDGELERYMLPLWPNNLVPIPKIRGWSVGCRHTDIILAFRRRPVVGSSRSRANQRLVGAVSVYFNRLNSRSGVGGLVVYDDVQSRYPIKVPARVLLGSKWTVVGTRQRRFCLSLASNPTVENIIASARDAFEQLPADENRAALVVYDERPLVERCRYQLVYLSPRRSRHFLNSGSSVLTLHCTTYDVVDVRGSTIVVKDNRGRGLRNATRLIAIKCLLPGAC